MRGLVADASSFNGGGGPSLGLDFMMPGVLDPRITFTRASTATYFNSAGVMQTAAVNQPRWDYDAATRTLRGLLIEEARTNVLPNGNAPTVLSGGATIAASADIQPLFAGAVVNKHTITGGPARGYVSVTGLTAATAYAFSLWLYVPTSVTRTDLAPYNNTGEGLTGTQTNASAAYYNMTRKGTWQRLTMIYTTGAAETALNAFFMRGLDIGDVFYTTAYQIEAGAFATSYVPTTSAAVTRAQDRCSISAANMAPWFNALTGSWFAEFVFQNPTSPNIRILASLGQPAGGSAGMVFVDPAQHVAQYDGGTALVTTSPALVVNAVSKGASTWAAGTGQVCGNGGAVLSGAMPGGFGTLSTLGVCFLIPSNPGVTDNATGYLRRVSYWSRALTGAEMQTVTTL
jgi:hypothetical protein